MRNKKTYQEDEHVPRYVPHAYSHPLWPHSEEQEAHQDRDHEHQINVSPGACLTVDPHVETRCANELLVWWRGSHLLWLCGFGGFRVWVHIAIWHQTSHLLDLEEHETQLDTIFDIFKLVEFNLSRDDWDQLEDLLSIRKDHIMHIDTYIQHISGFVCYQRGTEVLYL